MVHFLILIVLYTNAVAHYQDYNSAVLRSGKNGLVCPHGQAVDQLFRNRDYTCKQAPGGEDLECKDYDIDAELPFRCPWKGYVRSYWPVKPGMMRCQCCAKPGLYYSEQDCAINYWPFNYSSYTVYKGKFWTGFFTTDDK